MVEVRHRDLCTECNRSRASCFCKYTKPFDTNTRFVILMHPREYKRQRTGTGRVTKKSLINSEILMGIDFTHHAALNRALSDESFFAVLLYPGETAMPADSEFFRAATGKRRVLVVILDATWASARKMLRSSANLQQLPRVSFELNDTSRFLIKRQPKALCLSTIEAAYRLLDALDKSGYESLQGRHVALMETLDAIVNFQLRCAADPELPSHRLSSPKKIAAL